MHVSQDHCPHVLLLARMCEMCVYAVAAARHAPQATIGNVLPAIVKVAVRAVESIETVCAWGVSSMSWVKEPGVSQSMAAPVW